MEGISFIRWRWNRTASMRQDDKTGSDLELCIVALLFMVNDAADRGVMQAHRTANLRQAVTMVKMSIVIL
jgi:hypothetical protein